MKQCLACSSNFNSSLKVCSHCGASPDIIDGFEAYAPALAHGGGGFDAGYFSELAHLEGNHFWFRARNQLIIWVLRQYAPHFKSFLEIGCGTGFVLLGVANCFPDTNLNGSDIFTDGLVFASERLPSVNLMQMDARQIPFENEFDVVGAFDVIEHIEDDTLTLRQIYKSIKPEGVMLLTVPQHEWLWSVLDDYAFHKRRYSAFEIEDKVRTAGFKVLRSTSFVTSLLPAMLISRVLQKQKSENFDPTAELKINPLLNSFFEKILTIELAGIRHGMNYPVGGSRLIAAQKI